MKTSTLPVCSIYGNSGHAEPVPSVLRLVHDVMRLLDRISSGIDADVEFNGMGCCDGDWPRYSPRKVCSYCLLPCLGARAPDLAVHKKDLSLLMYLISIQV